MDAKKEKKSQWSVIFITIVFLSMILWLFSSCSSGSSSRYSGGEFRCTYCSKVIYSNYRPIHCTNLYNNVYRCNYCEHKNVIK